MNAEHESDHHASSSPNPIMRILKVIWLTIRTYFIVVGAIVTLVPLLIAWLFFHHGSDSHHKVADGIKKPSNPLMINVRLAGPAREAPLDMEDALVRRFFGGGQDVYLPNLRSLFRRATKDPQVKGVNIQLDEFRASAVVFGEIRRLLRDFRGAGKKIYFWTAEAGSTEYFLGSVADRLWIAPAGGLEIPGPVFQLMYFGDALKKLGVDVEVVRAGKFKSAFEPLVNNEPSPETLENYRAMEESLRAGIVGEIAASRGKSVEVVRNWFKQTTFTSQQAKESGLVDDVGFPNDVDDYVDNHYKNEEKLDKELVSLSVKDYLAATERDEDKEMADHDEGLGLIYMSGEIVMASDGMTENVISPYDARKEIEWARDDSDVKAVVIRVDSPGGSATASDIIWNDIRALAKVKPVVVSMGSVAASGGYYISVAASKIIAEPNTITGSIGVIGAIPKFQNFKDKYGVSFYIVTQSERAKLLNPGDTPTAQDKAILANEIDFTYQKFLERVAGGRKMKKDRVHELAQGRVYTGAEALELGLVDDLGGINDAFRVAKELGGLNPDKLYPLRHYEPEELDLNECLRNVSNMLRCYRDLDTFKLKQRISDHYSQVEMTLHPELQIASRLARMRQVIADDHHLALWLGGTL